MLYLNAETMPMHVCLLLMLYILQLLSHISSTTTVFLFMNAFDNQHFKHFIQAFRHNVILHAYPQYLQYYYWVYKYFYVVTNMLLFYVTIPA